MNVAQIIRLALFNADAVNLDSTTHPQITQVECLAWANEGRAKLEKHLRTINEDYLMIRLQSDDTDFRFRRETFDVSTLKYSGGTANATADVIKRLPPDCVKVKYIRPLTSGLEYIDFEHMDASHDIFKALRTSTNPQREHIFWDVVGEGSLFTANPPADALDIEIGYISRSQPLRTYTTGKVTLTKASAAVTGTSTLWEDNEVQYWGQNSDIIVDPSGTTANQPTIIGTSTSNIYWVDPSEDYWSVSAITSDTAATLLGNFLQTTISSANYMIASVSNLRLEDNFALADWVAYRIARKIGNFQRAAAAKASYDEHIKEMVLDAQQRQLADFEFVEDYEADYEF